MSLSPASRIYLDNAATTWPKPDSVYRAVDRYQRELGASPARGVYAESVQADGILHATRAALNDWLDGQRAEHVVFALNGTDALNLAIHGLLRPGDHAVTSVVDHNSVLRPLRWLEERGVVEVTRVDCGADGIVDPDDFRRALRPHTRLVALVHASNVTGALQPVVDVGQIVAEHGRARYLVDAAQSLGHVPLSVREAQIDLLAAPGHKGLLGPQGTGVLYIRPGVEREVEPLRQGGTGTRSDEDRQPATLPDRFEPGNVNAMGVAGLLAGVEWLAERGVDQVRMHAEKLTAQLLAGLNAVAGVRVYGPNDARRQAGVVSFTVEGYAPVDVATILDSHYRIQVRAGVHCAPRMHRALGTLDRGGTIRASLGPFNTSDEIDALVAAVRTVAETAPVSPVRA